MHETSEDLAWLRQQLDDSYARAGGHLTEIHQGKTRVSVERLVEELVGMQVLVVATVSSDARPFTAPVDGFFYRGRWYFGTSATAVRAKHLRANPAVSATHVRGETLVVTVHGQATEFDPADDPGFRDVLVKQYGGVMAGAPYFRIEPDRMFAADFSVYLQG